MKLVRWDLRFCSQPILNKSFVFRMEIENSNELEDFLKTLNMAMRPACQVDISEVASAEDGKNIAADGKMLGLDPGTKTLGQDRYWDCDLVASDKPQDEAIRVANQFYKK